MQKTIRYHDDIPFNKIPANADKKLSKSGANESTILKILTHSGIDQKDYKKVERRKTQTSRDDLASTCIENLRSAVHNSKS